VAETLRVLLKPASRESVGVSVAVTGSARKKLTTRLRFGVSVVAAEIDLGKTFWVFSVGVSVVVAEIVLEKNERTVSTGVSVGVTASVVLASFISLLIAGARVGVTERLRRKFATRLRLGVSVVVAEIALGNTF